MPLKKYIFISLLVFCFSVSLQAQKNKYSAIFVKANSIPDSLTYTSTTIAKYINDNFTTNKDKTRAIFYWMATHISYDIDNMFAINPQADKTDLIKKTLATQKGICIDYAYLFEDIATRCGILCITILGFTKQSGFVDYISHAWVTAKPDSVWLLYDPTWGSGHIANQKFVKEINEFYFETKPTELIKNHLPFDPLWQLLNYPLTQAEFFSGDFKEKKTKPFFNFNDSIAFYQTLSDIDKDIAAAQRIEKNGIKNTLTFDRLSSLKREVAYFQNKQTVTTYNAAAANFNQASTLFNEYIAYKNKQFTPEKPDPEIVKMIDTTYNLINISKIKLLEIKIPDETIASNINSLQKLINDLKARLDEESTFVKTYVATKKVKRKALFYKKTYSLLGN